MSTIILDVHETIDVPIFFWCSLRNKFEVHCFVFIERRNICVFFLFSEGKIEVLRKTSRTRTDEVQRRFPKTLSSITVIVQFRLLFRLRFLIRLDNWKEMSSLIALHLCTIHLWAQQSFRSRSVLSFGSMEKIGTQSWHFNLCTECPRSHCPFSGRGLVRSAFASRMDTSTWTRRCFSVSTQSRFFPLNMFKEKSLQHYCPLAMSGSNVFDLYTSLYWFGDSVLS